MKLKLVMLLVAAIAGAGASYALAASTKGPEHPGPPCRPVHLHGLLSSPSSIVVTVLKAGPKNVVTTNQVVTLTLGGTGQKVVADAEACTTGSGSTATLTTRHVNIRVSPPAPPGKPTSTGTTHS